MNYLTLDSKLVYIKCLVHSPSLIKDQVQLKRSIELQNLTYKLIPANYNSRSQMFRFIHFINEIEILIIVVNSFVKHAYKSFEV